MRISTMATRLILIFLLGGLVGWIVSRRPEATESIPPPEASAAEVAAQKKIRHPRSPQDFAEWAKERSSQMEPYGNWYKSHGAELADWPLEKIRVALSQGISDPGVVRRSGPEAMALHSLFAEFTKRDPDAAWAWLLKVPSEAMRAMLGPALANAWPADRAEEGMTLVFANRDYFESRGGYSYGPISSLAMESAAARGPAAVDELLGKMRREGMQMSFTSIKFPEGFDFAAWTRCPELAAILQKGVSGFFVNAWMARDPQAALDFAFALNREQGQPLASGLFPYVSVRSMREPEAVIRQAQQIAASTGTLPAEEQQVIYEAAAKAYAGNPEIFREFSAALQETGMRAEANLAAARTQFAKDFPGTLQLLEEGRSAEERIAVVEELLATRKPGEWSPLHATEQTAVRKILGDWKLPTERIDELVATFQSRPRPAPPP